MSDSATRLYKISEFAEVSGATVRTLHHYDQIGLLTPTGRSESGYRLYGRLDLERLQQIVALKFVGFSLKDIKELLDRHPLGVGSALRLQRMVMAMKVQHLQSAISAIDAVESDLQGGDSASEASLKKIIEVMAMEDNMDWASKYYDENAIAEHKKQWNPQMQEEVTREWARLIADVEASLNEDPAGPKAQALAERWSEMIGRFTQGKPKIEEGLQKLYADQKNWPANFKKPYSDEVEEFIRKAMAARK